MSRYYRSLIHSSGSIEEPFIFTVNTANTSSGSSNANQFKITFVNTYTYNCTVYWGDGTSNVITTWNDANLLHTYTTGGTYTISITGHFGWIKFDLIDELKLLTVEQWGTNLFTNMYGMFYSCINMSMPAIDYPNIDAGTDMSQMFFGCQSFNSDLSSWDTSNVIYMQGMFNGCTSFNQDLSDWDVSSVTSMSGMFYGCTSFNGDISGWDVSNVTDMQSMFAKCNVFNQDLSGWNTVNLNYTNNMFGEASIFNSDLSGWNAEHLLGAVDMFYNTSLSTANYDALLTGWLGWTGGAPTITLQYNIYFGAEGCTYTLGSDAAAARSYLINTLGWTISGDSGI